MAIAQSWNITQYATANQLLITKPFSFPMRCTGVVKPNPGFTMLELLVVMVILAILGTIAIPSYLASVRREQLTATSRSVVNWLEDARNEAVKEMVSCDVILTLRSNQPGDLEIKSSSPGCTKQAPLVIGDKDHGKTKIAVDGQQQGNIELLFSPRGTTSRNQEWTLIHQGVAGGRCIRISTPLGLIRLGKLRSNQCDYSQAI